MYSDSDEKTKAPSDNSTFSENTLSGLCHMLSRQRLELERIVCKRRYPVSITSVSLDCTASRDTMREHSTRRRGQGSRTPHAIAQAPCLGLTGSLQAVILCDRTAGHL